MGTELGVRRATPTDLETIVHFNQAMARETEHRELPPETLRSGVEGLFQAPQYGFYLVAETPDVVIGSLMVTFEWSDWRNGPVWWIQSVYVLPEWRRRGVYRRLYQHVRELAAAQGSVRGFRLYVERDNQVAQRTYRQLGMRESGYTLFEDMAD